MLFNYVFRILQCLACIVANCPGLPGTVPEKYAVSRVPDVRLPCPGYLKLLTPNRKIHLILVFLAICMDCMLVLALLITT